MVSTRPGARPQIPSWLRPIARRPGEIQFGVIPGGPIISGVTREETRLVAQLDGTRSVEATFASALESGVRAARWRRLLEVLADAGVVVDAPVSPSGRVVVDGTGVLADAISDVLSSGGIADVVHDGTQVDRVIADPAASGAHLVVLVGEAALDPRRGDVWLQHGVDHLPVVPAGRSTTVGPLVDGTHAGPCLWCLDLHRTDRDEAWPIVMAQLCGPADAVVVAPSPAADRAEPGLTQLVAGSVALFARRVLDGDRPPPGVSVEVSLPWPRMDHRRWLPHPRCPGTARARTGVA